MTTTLQEAFEENVRPFIDIIDELRSLGVDKDAPLPAVVVVGDQSAGKSSVLEAISGVELPRGTNIVTRCPLELRLKKIRTSKKQAEELLDEEQINDIPSPWKGCIFYKTEGSEEEVRETIEEPSRVGNAVEEATGKLTKGAKEISDRLIHLEVQSQYVPDLTLIDLPGIARVAVEGQSADVPNQIKALIKKYIQREETIILAVIPCNVDIATTEALQLAQQVDPDGKRTLGVLTKPDLVDEGTEENICAVVNGEKVKLKLGYTVVKCRGQKAIENKLSLNEAIESEEYFFKNHEVLKSLHQDKKTGVQNLSHQLTKQLVEQIKVRMPGLKEDISSKLSNVKRELVNYGDGLPESDSEKHTFLINLFMKLVELFKRLTKAEYIEDKKINGLKLYAESKNVFQKFAAVIENLKPEHSSKKLKDKVAREIKKQKGKELPSFLSYTVFEEIARQQIKRIIPHAEECLKEVNGIVEKTASTVIKAYLFRFEKLEMEVFKLVNEERKKAEINTTNALKTIFDMENLVFTQDANFTRAMRSINEENEKNARATMAFVSASYVPVLSRNVGEWFKEGEKMDAEHMTKCLEAYYEVASTRLVDSIPMAIYYHLVDKFQESMTAELMKLATKPESYKELLTEDPEIIFTRKKRKAKHQRLEKANLKLMKFGSSSSISIDLNNSAGIDEF